MDSFATWVLRGLSETEGKSRLSQMSDLIDWSPIRRILDEMYDKSHFVHVISHIQEERNGFVHL
jgi:phosphosulfolactate synthase (CoM biosynthesis protein A)